MRKDSRLTIGLLVAVLIASASLLAAAPAQAVDRDPASFVWIFSNTGYSSQDSALGMSRGEAWPIIFGTNQTVALRPTQNPQNSNRYWHQIGPGVGSSPLATSAADGRVAGAGTSSAFIVSPTGAITFLPTGTRSVDFTPGGALVYANGQSFDNVTGFAYNGTTVRDVAVSPFGDAGLITTGDQFYSTLTGTLQTIDNNLPIQFQGQGSLTFDAQGRPHAIDRYASAFSFDTVSGQWSVTSLGSTLGGKPAAIAADSQGTVGAAFVNSSSELIYAYWTNSAGWNTMVVDTGVSPSYQVGLEFDYEDLPVISYSTFGSLMLAYDPIVAVPEPGSLALVGGLGLVVLSRRRRSR